MRFKSKVVEIDAVQYTGKNQNEIADFYPGAAGAFGSDAIFIETLEGTMQASPGDWIIKGTEGEFYPCKPSVFERKYERA